MAEMLFFGPYSPPVTGQSLAFKIVVNSYPKTKYKLVDTTSKKSSYLNSIYSITASMWLLLRHKEISVVYFTCTRSKLGCLKDIPLLLLAGLLNKRIVNHLQGADFKQFYQDSGLLKLILKKAYKNIQTSIVLSKSMGKEFEDFKHMQIEVVPNCYPSEFENREIAKPKEVTITYLSNLLRSKGILEFLDAARIVSKGNRSVKFKIAGAYMDDHLMSAKELKKKVENSLNQDRGCNIQYMGKLDPGRRFEFLRNSSIFVLPTYYPTEGLPLSIVEAMRCGNVIVTTNHNYLPEIFSQKNGSIICPKSVEAIVESILKFISDYQFMKTIQSYNMKEAKQKYSERAFVSSIQLILSKN